MSATAATLTKLLAWRPGGYLRASGMLFGWLALDNLNRVEQPGLIQSADEWPAMRLIRSRLLHEYFERPETILPALRSAHHFVDMLCAAHAAIRGSAQVRFGG